MKLTEREIREYDERFTDDKGKPWVALTLIFCAGMGGLVIAGLIQMWWLS